MHAGAVAHDDLIGRPEGVVVATQRGSRLLAVRPTFAEQVTGRRRQAQPIYPKDLGAILVGADIFPGARVLEAGTGTGALTIALVRAVGPSGAVVSYELREEFLELARLATRRRHRLRALPERQPGPAFLRLPARGAWVRIARGL